MKKPDEGKTTGRPSLSAVQLRRLAEAADGRRGERLTLVFGPEKDGSSPTYHLITAGTETPAATEEVFPVETRRKRVPLSRKYDRGDVDSVKISFGQHVRDLELADKFDAVFWSESAVEKFVLEYYLPLKEKEDWDLMYRMYMNPPAGADPIFALAHEYPTVDTALRDVEVKVITKGGTHSVNEYLSANRHLME